MTAPYPSGHADRGVTVKVGLDYLHDLQKEIDDKHPRNMGVEMQAHHAISVKAISLGNYHDRLQDLGYNVNHVKNLVFIPSTLQGACLLQVQPHRGNHTAVSAPAIDGKVEDSYHVKVQTALKTMIPKIEEKCGTKNLEIKDYAQGVLNQVSKKIIGKIQKDPGEAKLTKLWDRFQPGDPEGCGGSIGGVNDPRGPTCPVHRNHTGKQGKGQPKEGIRYVCKEPYELTPGN